MSQRSKAPPLRRTSSEHSPLLRRTEMVDYGSSSFNNNASSAQQAQAGPQRHLQPPMDTFFSHRRTGSHHTQTSLRRFLVSTLGRDHAQRTNTSGTPAELDVQTGVYDQFTSVDWLHDMIADSVRHKELQNLAGIHGKIMPRLYAAQGWVLSAMVGVLVACFAYIIDIVEPPLFDLKFGYCTKSLFSSQSQCCSSSASCNDWITWNQVIFPASDSEKKWANLIFYVAVMLVLALISCIVVMMDRHVIRHPKAGAYSDKSTGRVLDQTADSDPRETVMYPSAGSGVAEVKVIASGFIIHGFLGASTLFTKAIGCILSVASGLSIGKEGPYVHIAACVGNISSRLFPSYHHNAGKRREIISASSAAGVGVAFGAPISGVLFSLEEVSYYFPAKTLFRTFFCSMIAAVTLKFLDPYGTSKIVLFQVKYGPDWKAIELVIFVFIGALGGAVGAIMVKGMRLWSRTFRSLPFIKKWPLLEVAIIALISALASFWNRYSRLPVTELMYELASSCKKFGDGGLCPEEDEIGNLVVALGTAFVIKSVLTTISFGIRVPAGIYVPSMVVGGLFGRAIGHSIQYVIYKYGGGGIFGSCAKGDGVEGCIVPGVYALIAAGATMCGVTRLSLTLAVMLFELTGSLDHVPVFSMAVLAAKWTADYIEPQSIYDFYLERSDLPFLDNKYRPNLTGELGDITPLPISSRTIDISSSPQVSAKSLKEKLDFLTDSGQFDSGLPILKEGVLIGLISCPDLAFCLDRIAGVQDALCLLSPRVQLHNFDEDEDGSETLDPTDFTPFVDPAPLALDVRSSTELVYDCFVKLGVRYVCVLRDGLYVSMIHRKAFIKYTREIQGHPRRSSDFTNGY